MATRTLLIAPFAAAVLALSATACITDDDPVDDDVGDEGGEGGTPCDPAADAVDESACAPLDSDFQSADPDNDPYPACISDSGSYELYADPPGSIDRVVALQDIADLLWNAGAAPRPDDFVMARSIYEIDQGLGSRVDRREDLHYPPVPEAEWDPGVDADKQCSVEALAEAYPDRCAGPAKLRPMINQAFIDGIEGNGDANVAAAKIEAAFMWFVYLSTYKEANTCIPKGKDCDSSWAYYTGGAQIGGEMLGLAKLVEAYSPNTHQRIFDGILAVRCWRDLYSVDDYPTYEDLPEDGQALYDQAWEQLDEALHRGLAVVIRQHALAQDDDQCSEATEANWTFVQITGDVLVREMEERGVAELDEYRSLLALDAPTTEDVEALVGILDTVFDCP
ncbi:hypothetical protein PPSIR1_13570 [Plesiocystis pacifica SIR-1]|uniref:Uncharacterized protein n=1 Tax=Plesiocystis pacifica SIR-1 TaxID=391625 RepID=A6GF14_9BACT|nr:hypothetical protein [Plesiocystis pacifica]EDM75541.1 hypothetical protein PPSIR1_13570 [Plesiocystis pacifica SIR-1]